MSERTKFILDEERIPACLVQHRRRPAAAAAAGAASGHRTADQARRPGTAVSRGAHRAGGVERARDRDPGRGARRSTGCGARRRSSAPAAWSRRPAYAGAHLLQVRGRQPGRLAQAEHGRGAGLLQPSAPACSGSATETGAGQWGSSLALACQFFGLECKVFMVKVSYEQKPYRRALMETFGARGDRQPEPATPPPGAPSWRSDPDCTGSLGIAISEAVEVAAQRADTKYAPRQRAQPRAAAPDRHRPGGASSRSSWPATEPDVVIGCAGGGSNFAGIAFPFIGRKLRGGREVRASSRSSRRPARRLTKGRYAYDFGDTAHLTPLVKMHTLGSTLRAAAGSTPAACATTAWRRWSRHVHGQRPDRGRWPSSSSRPSSAGVQFARSRGHHAGAGGERTPSPGRSRGAALHRGGQRAARSCSTSAATATSTCRPTWTTWPAACATTSIPESEIALALAGLPSVAS